MLTLLDKYTSLLLNVLRRTTNIILFTAHLVLSHARRKYRWKLSLEYF